jgi:site-specific recombinase XerD
MRQEELRVTVEDWLTLLACENRSSATLKSYQGHMNVFLKGLPGDELTPFTIRRFFQLYREGRSPHSVRTVFAVVHSFLRFAVQEGLTDEKLLTAMKLPKAPQTEKQIYTPGQLSALFRMLETDRTPLGKRNLALCSLLLDCGLRCREVCGLTVSDIQDGCVLVRQTKTGKIRTVPMGRKTQRAVSAYLATGRPRLNPRGEYLLVTRDGIPLNRNTVRLSLDRFSKKLGFKLGAHRFRHTFTTMLLRRGVDLETLRRLGGWSSYSMLMTYTHLAWDDLKRAHNGNSPLDNL